MQKPASLDIRILLEIRPFACSAKTSACSSGARRPRKSRLGDTWGAKKRQRPSQKEALVKALGTMIMVAELSFFGPFSMSGENIKSPTRTIAADAGWRFFLGDPRRRPRLRRRAVA